jgi:hypothetical protein
MLSRIDYLQLSLVFPDSRKYRRVFTDSQVVEIRSKFSAGVSCSALAFRYQVCPKTIARIVSFQSYKHVL